MRFSEIITETVPLSLAMPIRRGWNPESNKEIFQRFSKYAADKNLFRLRFPIKRINKIDGEDLGTMYSVFDLLSEFVDVEGKKANFNHFLRTKVIGFIPEDVRLAYNPNSDNPKFTDKKIVSDYIDGYVGNTDGTKKLKIGKLITSIHSYYKKMLDNQRTLMTEAHIEVIQHFIDVSLTIFKDFQNDPVRSANFSKDNFYAIVSRHPYDLAGMSTGRGWTSCTNLVSGDKSYTIIDDVKNGAMIIYMVRENDLDIQNPVSRITIYPAINEKDPTDKIFIGGESYGADSIAFNTFVSRFMRLINRGKAEGVYCVTAGQYSYLKFQKKRNSIDWYTG